MDDDIIIIRRKLRIIRRKLRAVAELSAVFEKQSPRQKEAIVSILDKSESAWTEADDLYLLRAVGRACESC